MITDKYSLNSTIHFMAKGDKAVCPWCGDTFIKKSSTNIYCCPGCRTQTEEERMAKKYSANRFKLMERDGFKCFYCGKRSFDEGVILVLDHVIPRSKGGEDSHDNLVTCCMGCNYGKQNMMIEENTLADIQKELRKRNSTK